MLFSVQKQTSSITVIKMGRTHLQDAVPIRLGQEFEAYSRVLARDIKELNNLANIYMK